MNQGGLSKRMVSDRLSWIERMVNGVDLLNETL